MRANKKITYFLAVVLLIVWGAIGYQIITALSQKDDDEGTIATTFDVEKDFKKSSYLYIDDVRDPFKFSSSVKAESTSRVRKPAIASPINVPPPFRLTGIVLDKNKKTAMLEGYNGSVYFLHENDTIDGLKILKITENEVNYFWRKQKGKWELTE
ncbi:MAG TPA: hypothetical protein PK595_02110 [Bacteroidota bacterium]|jgi:hypothetical protein|nr:hypothetical protein [Bacteroidota bacterium]